MEWKLQDECLRDTDLEELIEFIRHSPRFTQFEKVREFENKFSQWLGTEYSVFVNSGSSANLLLIGALKELMHWKTADEIIVPSVTWVTNISPIIQMGLEPKFIDINLEDLSFDYGKLEKAITKKTKAIFITHLIGIPANIDIIKSIVGSKDILIIEDCCESHGASFGGKKIGNFGIGSTFSFYWAHHITTIEGGMICTNDENFYKMLLLKRSHGLARELPNKYHDDLKKKYPDIDFNFLFLTDGYNLRNTEINAVLGLIQLRKLNAFIKIRNENYKKFVKICDKYKDNLILLKSKGLSSFSLPFLFRSVGRMSNFKEYISTNGIETRPIISGNLLKQPFLKEYSQSDNFPNADHLHSCGFYIGNNQFVNDDKLNYLNQLMDEFFN
jgi:CDP-6-deoxy-D-xylo-4-hexulose-3-dehydrase